MSVDARVIVADCVEAMRDMPEASVDAIVTDPPYHLRFMGKGWDHAPTPRESQAMHEAWAREALRVLKPGGYLLAFGGSRTSHRLAAGIEDAGFEVRDTIMWLYGSGFPKSLDVSKAIDRAAGAECEVVGQRVKTGMGSDTTFAQDAWTQANRGPVALDVTTPATPEVAQWQGWGTALKPAHEPIIVARKPLTGTVAANVLAHGTGALNVDGCRVEGVVPQSVHGVSSRQGEVYGKFRDEPEPSVVNPAGRWPANVVLSHTEDCVSVGTREVASNGHFPAARGASGYGSAVPGSNGGGLKGQDGLDERRFAGESVEVWECSPECPVRMLDEQTGDLAGCASPKTTTHDSGMFGIGQPGVVYGDRGGASRFFYVAKASSAERNAGLDGFEERPAGNYEDDAYEWATDGRGNPRAAAIRKRNVHPTVKPIELMGWLVRLVTPPGGLVLDPFAGSGTTGCAAVLEGFRFVGIEREAEYAAIAEARIAWWAEHPEGVEIVKALEGERKRQKVAEAGQLGLL